MTQRVDVDRYGRQRWYVDNQLHRDGDLPAVIHASGTQEWYQHGVLHRDGEAPAIVFADGWRLWFRHDRFVREAQGTDFRISSCIAAAVKPKNRPVQSQCVKREKWRRESRLTGIVRNGGMLALNFTATAIYLQ